MLKKIIFVFAVVSFFVSPYLEMNPHQVFAEKGSSRINILPVPPNLTASVKFYEPSGNNILDADETGKLIITVQNNGKGDAFDVKAEIRLAQRVSGLSFDRDVLIGTVPAGESGVKEIKLMAGEDTPT